MSIEDSGYEILPHVVPRGALEKLLEVSKTTPLKRTKAGIRHLLHDSRVMEFANCNLLVSHARRVLGSSAAPFRATLFDKSPDSNWLVTWHQDTALSLKKPTETPGWGPWSLKDGIHYAHAPASALEQVLALRIQIDDSTLSNGALRVLPATHGSGVLSDEEIHAAAAKIPAVECSAPAGSVLMMRPLLIHASSKSVVTQPRRVLHIEYSATTTFGPGLDLAVA